MTGTLTDFPAATNAERIAKSSTTIWDIQQRDRARARDGLSVQLSHPQLSENEVESLRSTGHVVEGSHVPWSVHLHDGCHFILSMLLTLMLRQARRLTMTTYVLTACSAAAVAWACSAAILTDIVSCHRMATSNPPGECKDLKRDTTPSQSCRQFH